MALVDYSSDSDSSDKEEKPAVKATVQSTKSSFQKVVDRSNPGRIRVTLPTAAAQGGETKVGDEPPAKRARTGAGAFSGFNSFLPPPKKTGAAAPRRLGGGGNGAGRVGLGAGISLKTGAAPAFSRTPEAPDFYNDEDYNDDVGGTRSTGGGMSLPPPKASLEPEPLQKPAEEVKLVGKPLMFKPLSVSRKPQKKRKPVDGPKPVSAGGTQSTTPTVSAPAPAPLPKVSLFSMAEDTDDYTAPAPTSRGEYQPLIYNAKPEPAPEEAPYPIAPQSAAVSQPTSDHSLTSIASDLHLSAAERRQLFGRNGRNATASKVINFNTDEEYRHNEELRASGEQVTHHAVRSIAPGKHSLKQLVNAAASQKEALEESFAKGYANRKEASGKYGW
jgi:hypothetical protein